MRKSAVPRGIDRHPAISIQRLENFRAKYFRAKTEKCRGHYSVGKWYLLASFEALEKFSTEDAFCKSRQSYFPFQRVEVRILLLSIRPTKPLQMIRVWHSITFIWTFWAPHPTVLILDKSRPRNFKLIVKYHSGSGVLDCEFLAQFNTLSQIKSYSARPDHWFVDFFENCLGKALFFVSENSLLSSNADDVVYQQILRTSWDLHWEGLFRFFRSLIDLWASNSTHVQ